MLKSPAATIPAALAPHMLVLASSATALHLCRDSDFAGQQQVASKLHKLVGADDDYYVWWTIVAVTLQARAAHQGAASALPAAKLFQLAEVMTAKQAQKGRLQSYEQLSLYLHILQVCMHIVPSHMHMSQHAQIGPSISTINSCSCPALDCISVCNAMTSTLTQHAFQNTEDILTCVFLLSHPLLLAEQQASSYAYLAHPPAYQSPI